MIVLEDELSRLLGTRPMSTLIVPCLIDGVVEPDNFNNKLVWNGEVQVQKSHETVGSFPTCTLLDAKATHDALII